MGTPPTDESIFLFGLLQDGRWHSYPVIKERIALRVSPGKAIRAYEARMKPEREARQDPNYNTKETEEEKIEFGKSDVAQGTISSWVNRGLESWGKRNRRVIRVRPGFESYKLPKAATPPVGDEFAPGATPPGPVPPGGSEGPLSPPEGPSVLEPVSFDERIGADVDAELASLAAESFPEPESEGAGVAEDAFAVPELVEPSAPILDRAADFVPEPPSLSVMVKQVLEELPGCVECGLPVRDWEIHKHWHVQQGMAQAVSGPVLDVAEFEKLLDTFQVGMQRWMLMQFAQLEAKVMNRQGNPARWRDGGSHQKRH